MIDGGAPDRSRRVYVWWGVGFAFLAALGLFCLLVLGPALEAHRAVKSIGSQETSTTEAVAQLGGSGKAAAKLSVYLHVPARLVGTHQRQDAATLLGSCGEAGVPPLIRALSDADWWVRMRAAWGLYATGPAARAAVPALIKALGDPVWNVREAAAKPLGRLGPEAKAAVPALIRNLSDGVWRVRSWTAEALGDIGPDAREAVPALTGALDDPDGFVRVYAARALARIEPGNARARPTLEKALDHEDKHVRQHAAEVLKEIEGAADAGK